MKKLLFIIFNYLSSDVLFILDNFIQELPNEEYECHCLAPLFVAPYLIDHSLIKLKILSQPYEFNTPLDTKESIKSLKDWQNYYDHVNPDLVIFLDLDSFIINETNSLFKRNWIDYIKCPMATLEFNDNLVLKSDGIVNKYASKLNVTSPSLKLEIKRIISCPPNKASFSLTQDNSTFYFANKESFSEVVKLTVKSSIYDDLKTSPDKKIIMYYVSPSSLLQCLISNLENFHIHYINVVKTLVYYLEQLNIPTELLICNLEKIENLNSEVVKLHYFPYLSIEAYKRWLKGVDLIFLESIQHPILIDAASLGIPSIVLGNSVEANGNNNFNSNIPNPIEDNTIIDTINIILQQAPHLLFKYSSFPNKSKLWLDPGLYINGYAFYFADLFDKKGTTWLINKLLLDNDFITKTKNDLKDYIKNNLDLTSTSEEILQEILK